MDGKRDWLVFAVLFLLCTMTKQEKCVYECLFFTFSFISLYKIFNMYDILITLTVLLLQEVHKKRVPIIFSTDNSRKLTCKNHILLCKF